MIENYWEWEYLVFVYVAFAFSRRGNILWPHNNEIVDFEGHILLVFVVTFDFRIGRRGWNMFYFLILIVIVFNLIDSRLCMRSWMNDY